MVDRTVTRLEESANGKRVVLRDAHVTQVALDYALRITVGITGGGPIDVKLSTPFYASGLKDERIRIDPEQDTSELGTLVVSLRGRSVCALAVDTSQTLRLAFDRGLELESSPDADYESWDISCDDFKIVAVPGAREPVVWLRDRAP